MRGEGAHVMVYNPQPGEVGTIIQVVYPASETGDNCCFTTGLVRTYLIDIINN